MAGNLETGEFISGEGLTEEEAKKATAKLLAEKREKIIKEVSEDVQKLLESKGNKLTAAIYDLKNILVKSGISEDEASEFVKSYVETSSEVVNNGNDEIH